jgi:DNA-binding winged helix-turn-helix (wHTH) protein
MTIIPESAGGPTPGHGLLRIDLRAHEAWYGDRRLDMTRMVFRLLVELARRQGAVVTREQLLARVWEDANYGPTQTVATHVAKLRQQLGPGRDLVRTVKNVGYMLAAGSLAEPVGEPLPSVDRQQALDLVEELRGTIANLGTYIEARAAELATPRIAAIRQDAEQRVAELTRQLAVERERRKDLQIETRRQVRVLEQQLARAQAQAGSSEPEGVPG